MNGEQLARLFHETYEKLAPAYGYQTRKASAKPWEDVPKRNKQLMIAVAGEILSAQKKQTAEDCIEDCAVVDSNRQLRKAVSCLNSMILSGESHSKESTKIVEQSLNVDY